MIATKKRLSFHREASGMAREFPPNRPASQLHWQPTRSSAPEERYAQLTAADTSEVNRRAQVARFLQHYGEMCLPMCAGFAIGDLLYFWAAGNFGYSEPFRELPELSVVVVTVAMTAPMAAWMLFRRMPPRPIVEMSAVMPVLAIVLLGLGWLGVLPKSDLALAEHGLMMPAMLIPMFLRLNLYTGRVGHRRHSEHAARPSHS
jgi:hypothetical protein